MQQKQMNELAIVPFEDLAFSFYQLYKSYRDEMENKLFWGDLRSTRILVIMARFIKKPLV